MMTRQRCWIFGLACSLAGLAPALQSAPLYENDFTGAAIGQVPDDFLILDGQFAVREAEGNRFLELPGDPLDTFGVLFGPSARDGLAISARIQGSSKGRRFPAFAVSLGGVGGFRLEIAPAKKAIEILQGEQVVASAAFAWQTDAWTHLRLQVVKRADDTWRVQGKVWTEGTTEPADWMIQTERSQAPVAGRAGVWGKPFSGTPIRFDDLRVTPAIP
jgi:hypothetical protein